MLARVVAYGWHVYRWDTACADPIGHEHLVAATEQCTHTNRPRGRTCLRRSNHRRGGAPESKRQPSDHRPRALRGPVRHRPGDPHAARGAIHTEHPTAPTHTARGHASHRVPNTLTTRGPAHAHHRAPHAHATRTAAESPCTSPTVVDQALEALVADCESLWAFYRLQDSEWPFAPGPSSAWNSRNPIQDWRGVIVSDGRVTQLTLHRLDLSGTITGDPLHNLTRLKKLHLIGPSEGSQLGGAIPVWLGDATSLRELLLINHNLTGPIPPELANLANLVRLDLSNNQLTGPIPPELANLTNLRHLDVSEQPARQGAIPPGSRPSPILWAPTQAQFGPPAPEGRSRA